MTFLKFDHIGIVVKDIDTAVATYERNFDLKKNPDRGGDLPAMQMKNAFIPVGDVDLEFIQATSDTGPVADFTKERGEGQFLLSIAVDDIQAAVDHLRSLGFRAGNPNGGIAFVSMKSTNGVNLQLVQRS
ncbi:hypothetical protein AYO38_09895 [bacterium SCGC AG-212-C10]|nr:hypothetical protein AYO38_09895 [bacterium SCGC AG-212-C10]